MHGVKEHKRFLTRLNQSELARLLLSIAYLIGSGFTVAYLQQLSDQRWFNQGSPAPLKDLLLDSARQIEQEWVPDLFVLSALFSTLLMLVLTARTWPHRAVALRRMAWVVGSLYLYRALTISVTTLPAVRECVPNLPDGRTSAQIMLTTVRMTLGLDWACTDMIYSGHTMVLVTCIVQWMVYCKWRWVGWYWVLHSIAGIVFMVFTRFHYSVDIALAVFITYGMWSVYFLLVRYGMERWEWEQTAEEKVRGGWWGRKDEVYQRVAWTPRQLNAGIVLIVRWLDGLDIRQQKEARLHQAAALASQPAQAPVTMEQVV